MDPDPAPSRRLHRAGILAAVGVLAWFCTAFWNFVKPMPPGTHVASLPARLAESQVDFITDPPQGSGLLQRESALVDRAEQLIVVDECPLAAELTEHLLARKRQRPNLKIVLVTDPRNQVYGGTPARTLSTLERAGIIVARTRLERLRDSNPVYSSLWRLCLGWWSDPYDEAPGSITLLSTLRRLNFKANRRHLLVADDGAGGWASLLLSAAARAAGDTDGNRSAADAGLEIHGHLARDIVVSELQIAAWSTDDDRLPPPPPIDGRGVGTIDARFLTEGAIRGALREALAVAASGDSISVAAPAIGDRQLVEAMLRAAGRGAHLKLLIDAGSTANQAVAAELERGADSNIEVRWRPAGVPGRSRFVLLRHRNDVWLQLGSADLTRRGLDDLDLGAGIELHMPARAVPARVAAAAFARDWSGAAAYADHADATAGTYWHYRLAEATGLPMF